MRHTARFSLVVLVAALGACGWMDRWHGWGGGKGGGSGGGGTNPPVTPPAAAPTIAISAPVDGAVIYGSRDNIAVTGTVTGSGIQSVTVTVNGAAAAAATVNGGTFTAQVTLADRANTLVAAVTASGGSASASVRVTYPFVSVAGFQAAERVIGQADAAHGDANRGGAAAANTISTPYGAAAFDGTHLFVPDSGNSRVLAFDGIPAADGADASYAIGQSALDQAVPSSAANGLTTPQTIRWAGSDLLVVDYWNNRIGIYDPIPANFGATAMVAVGASSPDVRGTASCTGDGLSPESMFVVGGKLIVGDAGNNRVLIWNSIPTVSGAPPDLVLGQKNLSVCEPNAGGVSASSMNYPTDAWSDGTRLFVADAGNNRILGWWAFPTTSDTAADFVLGQTGFDQTDPALSSAGLNGPYSLASNGNQLFVADSQNNRVLVWNTLPTATGALPDVVLGQGSFDQGAANANGTPSGQTLNMPTGVLVLDDALLVTDGGNSRFLVFGAQ